MELQNWEKKRAALVEAFKKTLAKNPALKGQQIKFSWSNWGFGMESLDASARRLQASGIEWIELHGNRYGKDLGYKANEVLDTLGRHGVKTAGICGMFGAENDMASNSGLVRQNAIDYIRRQIDLCNAVGGSYILVVPAAVGRPRKYDDSELARSIETLQIVADEFAAAGIRAAIEPIRSAEVSIVHSFAEAKAYIKAVGSPGVQHINGDVYHMQVEEPNIAESIVDAGEMLTNLHLADSNRCALGAGSMDIDAIIMALYVIGYTEGPCFATPEPLGPGGDPYPAMFGQPNEKLLGELVSQSAKYWREREAELKKIT